MRLLSGGVRGGRSSQAVWGLPGTRTGTGRGMYRIFRRLGGTRMDLGPFLKFGQVGQNYHDFRDLFSVLFSRKRFPKYCTFCPHCPNLFLFRAVGQIYCNFRDLFPVRFLVRLSGKQVPFVQLPGFINWLRYGTDSLSPSAPGSLSPE